MITTVEMACQKVQEKLESMSDDELVAMAKAAPDNGGKLLVELNEFILKKYAEETV